MLAFAAKVLLLATIPVLRPGEKVAIDTAGMRVEENKLVNYHVFGYLRDMPPAMTALHSNEIVRSTHPFWDSVRLLPSVTASELPPTTRSMALTSTIRMRRRRRRPRSGRWW